MKQSLTCISIIQNQRGVLQFAEIDTKTKNPKNDTLVNVNFKDPKQAAEYAIGDSYEISITKKK